MSNRVVYTGTHDNDTSLGWWRSATRGERERFRETLERAGIEKEDDTAWAFVRLAFASPARLAIVPLQDVLGLGSEARMNRPGSATGNWRWKLRRGALTVSLAERLREAVAGSGRTGTPRKIPQTARPRAATLRRS